MKKILLIITGSIAAYKAVELIRILQKKSYEVEVILTKAAQEFVTPLLVASIAKNKIHSELFNDGQDGMAHINLSRQNDLIVVAPASADFLAKMANGFGDDLASTTILASNKKIIAAPAMNEKMWFFSANLQNIAKLKKSGVIFVEPTKDELACGEIGVGKMKEPSEIAAQIDEFFTNQNRLKGKKIILTGGATREMIDPVRFISNESSGKQAIYLAQVLSEMGAEIDFIAGNINLEIPLAEEKITRVKSAKEMFASVMQKIEQSKPSDTIFISCAAVADYCVKNPSETKIKKESSEILTLYLEKNEDILKNVANHQNRPAFVIGFAAENENLLENAKNKLKNKNCDLILANEVENGAIFGAEESKSYLISKNEVKNLGQISKKEVARIIANSIPN
jgi:phosphopantothenoylcysteine decarboxylase/phosphopantothenate--cysteine ligase